MSSADYCFAQDYRRFNEAQTAQAAKALERLEDAEEWVRQMQEAVYVAQKMLYAPISDDSEEAVEGLRVAKKRLFQAEQQMSQEAKNLLILADKLAAIANN